MSYKIGIEAWIVLFAIKCWMYLMHSLSAVTGYVEHRECYHLVCGRTVPMWYSVAVNSAISSRQALQKLLTT